MKRVFSMVCPALVLALAVSGLPAAGAEANPGSAPNVRVTFTLGKVEGKDKKTPLKSFALVVLSGDLSSLLTGARVPIPTTQAADEGSVTTYTYQNVGLSAQVEAEVVAGGEVQIKANVEHSWIDPETKNSQPVVETRHQQIRVSLKDGAALEITRSSDGEELRYVEVKADILK